ncbi:MAG: HAMP domain-containing histidine kinase, partial [Deltaproteobacteria bacterium]|nr:HAMP domain-containing histidine kinase [Deltaproteobacteria bacterium]
IGFKFVSWYSGIFVLSSLLLFAIIYFFISSMLSKHDRGTLLSELEELAAQYRRGGIASVEKLLTTKRKFHRQHSLFVRIAGTQNNTARVYLPYQWMEFDIPELERITPDTRRKWINLPSMDGGYALEIATTRLPDGHWLQVGMSTEDRERILHRIRGTFVTVTIPVFLLGFLFGGVLSYRTLRPIRHLIRTVESIDTGKMDARVTSPGTGDELDKLIGLFNRMLEKIETLIVAMRGSLDNVAHDLRTPITRFRNMAETALRSDGDVKLYRETLSDSLEESDKILKMLDTLMDISEAETGVMNLDRKIVNIRILVEKVVDVYRHVAEEKGLSIDINAPNGLHIPVDQDRMGLVLANLLDNAIEYTPAGGQISLEVRHGNQEVIISIRDTGIGISKRDLPRIWDRLYRGDQNACQKGLGLGLSQVKAIIRAHNGRTEVISEPGKGSTFTIRLPAEH